MGGFNYMVVDALDSPAYPMQAHFEDANAFIEEARLKGEKVLVHCQVRSACGVPTRKHNSTTGILTFCCSDICVCVCVVVCLIRAQHTSLSNIILKAGMSRSATVVLSYLMWHSEWTLRQAHGVLVASRPVVLPNEGFFEQLLRYERRLFSL